ncbi:MAG: PLD nuclease N-terminal domain-containing protein [Candidatus Dojkabacteria bacterium]|jgi:prolipoprotein diacylglyceryltransferase|nr:PLD nuclease N-terminal domain-containing protein [Candidatus Dojkabacteria bacterium]
MQDDLLWTPFACLSQLLFCLPVLFALVGGIFGLITFVLWIWMLVDLINRDEDSFPSKGGDQKVLWILILIFGNWIGALVYYLVVYKKDSRKK